MPKDYARNIAANKARFQKKGWRKEAMLILVLGILAIGGIFYWVAKQQNSTLFSKENVTSWVAKAKSLFKRPEAPTTPKTTTAVAVKQPEEVQFDFYTELPNMQVNAPAKPVASPAPPPAPVAATATKTAELDVTSPVDEKPDNEKGYILQLGAFKDPTGAGQLRLSLLLSGLQTDVVKTAENGTAVYRVQQGPYPSEKSAKTAQQKLESKGFEAVIKKAG